MWELNCTYWALAHIVHVVGTAGKQPTTWDWWMDTRWRGTDGIVVGKEGPSQKVSVCLNYSGLNSGLIL